MQLHHTATVEHMISCSAENPPDTHGQSQMPAHLPLGARNMHNVQVIQSLVQSESLQNQNFSSQVALVGESRARRVTQRVAVLGVTSR